MTDTSLNPLIFRTLGMLAPLLVLSIVGVFVILRRRDARVSPLAPPVVGADGVVSVPVRGLFLHSGSIFGGTSRNSINPRFAIAPDGLHYRVFRERILPFSQIDHIDVREWFGRVHLLFVSDGSPRLLGANVGDRAAAKQVLDALPRTLALTAAAATLRDGSADAATPGLRPYRAVFA